VFGATAASVEHAVTKTAPRGAAEPRPWARERLAARSGAEPVVSSAQAQRGRLGLLAWTRNPGRLADIGRAFGTQPRTIGFSRFTPRWCAPLRYVISILLSVAWLLRVRPRTVIVSCPPPVAALIVAAYARLTRAGFILDAHPGAFGHRDKLWAAFVPVHRYLIRRARVTLVTCPALAKSVTNWGGRPLIFHEAPPAIATADHHPGAPRPYVAFATVFDPDEPIEAIVAAARALPDVTLMITGNPARMAPEHQRALRDLPHVRLTGWLSQTEYLELIAGAAVVVALTEDPHSVMRSAFEAVYLERPTVISDTQTLRSYFSPGVFVQNSSEAIVAGVRHALADDDTCAALIARRRALLIARWERQRAALGAAIGSNAGETSRGAVVGHGEGSSVAA
jgi:glycosyltransferase involved in cell wall biosynthesis